MNYIERTTNGTRWEASLDGGKTWHRGVPVSFTAENAQKCFDSVKTQTRRLMRKQPSCITLKGFPVFAGQEIKPALRVGDIFYIREPWRTDMAHDKIKPTDLPGGAPILFDCALDPKGYLNPGKLRPAMFLQRRFARTARYQVTDVRYQRVTEISEADAMAEGIEASGGVFFHTGKVAGRDHSGGSAGDARTAFGELWNAINTKPGTRFEDSPWVWAYTFKRVR